jgi:hypothetical protein
MKTMWNNITWYFRKLKRVWDFLPHVWRGYDFDYRYAVDLFSYQLTRTADHLESDKSYTVNADMHARKIRTAIDLMKRVYEDEYDMEWMDQLQEIYGPSVLDWWFEDTGKGDDSSYLRYVYEKWDNADEVEAKKAELVKASREKQKKAERILWAYIQHNIRNWWD